jgi:antibiotic biosynthesis monooxygenase (ABM) superfamily enzyme
MMRSEGSDNPKEEEEEEQQQQQDVVVASKRELIHCNSCPNETGQPLTVFAKHSIIPGKEKEFEAWVKKMTVIQKHAPGYLSSELIRPAVDEQEYVSIFRYDSYRNLQKWMASKERDEMIEKACAFSSKPLAISFHSLEYWFVSEQGRTPPARWKMTIITFLVIFSQLQFLPEMVGLIPNLPMKLGEALTTAIVVILTTYVWFPILTRLFAFWLFPDEDYWAQFKSLKQSILKKDIESGE